MANINVNTTELLQLLDITPADHNLMLVGGHGIGKSEILTDGYAPEPWIPDNMRCKIIWVCQDKNCYEAHHHWMEKSGRVCTIELR